jgi:hypothetical protein
LIVLGRSLGKTREPLRIAEEYAMLDCLSGGRLVAGLPVGLSYDANLNNGIPMVETRERYEEAVELMFRSWTAEQPFTWNGRFSQYSLVNSWPRPLQKPRSGLRRRAGHLFAARGSRCRRRRGRRTDVGDGLHGEVRLADSRQGSRQAHPPNRRSDARRVGEAGCAGLGGLRIRVRQVDR